MAYKFREEIVGKRFLSVSGFTKLKVNKISEWGWRAGVIRAASHRDNGCHDLQSLKGQRLQTSSGIPGSSPPRPPGLSGGYVFRVSSFKKCSCAPRLAENVSMNLANKRALGSLPEVKVIGLSITGFLDSRICIIARFFIHNSSHCFNAAFAAHLPRPRRSTVILGARNIHEHTKRLEGDCESRHPIKAFGIPCITGVDRPGQTCN
ncbi:Uncharacterized protein DBV15_00858 [Temnothorax longispinosus]|uniref:DUF7030 domain-containing protein n=1 Tax=Temnothorax longispinosus TaxID=300112 RepID=A0A4S2KKJ9_9HYME|nr:Uncharacterized protein DBV15_00858 [Temnothorax longispinosus]